MTNNDPPPEPVLENKPVKPDPVAVISDVHDKGPSGTVGVETAQRIVDALTAAGFVL